MMELNAQFFQDTLPAGRWEGTPLEGSVSGLNQDTRTLHPGDCFVALKTDKRDGHDFLANAQSSGAIAALVSHADPEVELAQFVVSDPLQALQDLAHAHRKKFSGKVVGITGSAGKTSTKELLATLLGEPICVTQGNFNNTLGLPISVLRLEDSDRWGVFEAGIDRAGEMDVLAGVLEPDVGIVTLVAEAHLERLGSLEGVAHEKAKLLQNMRTGGLCIFPDACLQYPEFKDLAKASWVLTRDRELNLESDLQTRIPYWTETTDVYHDGVRLCIAGPVRPVSQFDLPPMSSGMVSNAALAILAAQHAGIEDSEIQRRLRSWTPADKRGQWRAYLKRNVFVDCYNANPASMVDSARFFDEQTQQAEKRIFILGTMNELGEDAASYHRSVGERLPLRSRDLVYCVGAHAADLKVGVDQSGRNVELVETYPDVDALRETWREMTGVIFLKGSRGLSLETLLDIPCERKVPVC